MAQTVTDDPVRRDRTLELAGLGESGIREADKRVLRDWYQEGGPAEAARVQSLLKRVGPVSVRVGSRLIDFRLVDGRDDLISATWNPTDRAARGAHHQFDDGPRGVCQIEKPITPPPSVRSSQSILEASRRSDEIQRLRERLDALERASR